MSQMITPLVRQKMPTFGLAEDDVAVLSGFRDYFTRILPPVLDRLHGELAGWTELAALKHPQVHAVRLSHWTRTATGDWGDGFVESAQRLAQTFYAEGIPGYAVAVCHYTVSRALMETLRADLAASSPLLPPRCPVGRRAGTAGASHPCRRGRGVVRSGAVAGNLRRGGARRQEGDPR